MGKLIRPLGGIERHLGKSEILELARQNAAEVVRSGKYDLLRVYVELKRYELYLKEVIKALQEPTLQSLPAKKSVELPSARLRVYTRRKYDFSVDPTWSELDRQIKELQDRKKEREKLLKTTGKVPIEVDEQTGEVLCEQEIPQEIVEGLRVEL